MFNWFKKTAMVEKVAPDVAAIRNSDTITPLAMNESVAFKDQGNAYLNNNKLEEAAECFRQAIARNPRYAEAYTNLGLVFQMQGDLDGGIALYRKAVAYKPELLTAHMNLGLALMNLRQEDVAEESFRRVLALDPVHAAALQSLGVIALQRGALAAQRGDFVSAEILLRRALELQPDYAEAYYNLGTLFMETKCLFEAEAPYRRALELKPDYVAAHTNLGTLLQQTMRLSEAEASFRSALELKPDYAEAHINLGILLLSLGRYAEAWPHHEYRYDPSMKKPFCEIPSLPCPQWRGESLVGKSLVLLSEQGFGDNIQFARYTLLLRERGASRLTLVGDSPLKALLETMAGVDAVITELPSVSTYDYWSFPLSLPLYFGTTVDTIPVAQSYLHALPARVDRWRDRLPKGKFRVGLVWKGNADQPNDANRSLPGLSTLAALWSVPGVEFVSLQKGQSEDEAKNPPADQPIVHLGSEIGDFADTAAIIDQLDLVICVCTSVAHLAGAMGKPCWVLITAVNPCWRWLREREDSPWYPSLRLFRQEAPGDWSQPVERMRHKLMAITHAGS